MAARRRGRGNRSDSSALLKRQWAVLQMLPRAPRAIDTPTLAARLETEHGITVLPRTLQRELLALTSIFPVIVDDSAKPYRWSWSTKAPTVSMPLVDPRSALVLLLVDQYLRHAAPPEWTTVLDPLVDAARRAFITEKKKLGTWLRSVRVISRPLALERPRASADVFGAVSEALLERRQVRLNFGGKKPRDFVMNPLGLVLKDGIGYVVGNISDRSPTNIRSFAINRAQHAEVLARERDVPNDFDLDRFIAESGFGGRVGGKIWLKVRFRRDGAPMVTEAPLSAAQRVKTERDGGVVVTVWTIDTPQLRSWLLSFGASAEIMAPKALREWAATTAQHQTKLYKEARR